MLGNSANNGPSQLGLGGGREGTDDKNVRQTPGGKLNLDTIVGQPRAYRCYLLNRHGVQSGFMWKTSFVVYSLEHCFLCIIHLWTFFVSTGCGGCCGDHDLQPPWLLGPCLEISSKVCHLLVGIVEHLHAIKEMQYHLWVPQLIGTDPCLQVSQSCCRQIPTFCITGEY